LKIREETWSRMWNYKYLTRIDFRMVVVIFLLMSMGILVISSFTVSYLQDPLEEEFFTPQVKNQLKSFAIGWAVFIFFAGFDYNKIREWTWILYGLMLLSLVGLFFTDPIQRVQRWYRIPLLGSFQPSEYAKLSVVIALSWFLERRRAQSREWGTVFFGGLIAGIPFLLILKQPDLGTAFVLFPIILVMFYFGDIHPKVIQIMTSLAAVALIFVALIFLGVIDHEQIRPYATKVLKDYQFERLNPNTYHQKAATTAIALGGLVGKGWRKSDFTGGGWLPAAYTDSVFPAFGEEYGFVGLFLMLLFFYMLIYFSFQVTTVAVDHFGRLLAAGVAVYLAMSILVSVGMMCGLLPITGVPLVLVSYGGSSILSTMISLGILQSIYSRRFMF
jgi:rod shape determining protein RodA